MGKMSQKQIDASLDKLKADIAEAVESATTMRQKVQHALVGCVSHWSMTGSNKGLMDIVNGFLDQLGQGVNLKAVKAWCEKHLHMQEDAEGKRLVFRPVKSSVLDTKAAAEEHWWTLKPQQVFSFDLTAAIIALAKKAAKASEQAETDPEADVKLDADLYAQIMQLEATAKAKADAYEPKF